MANIVYFVGRPLAVEISSCELKNCKTQPNCTLRGLQGITDEWCKSNCYRGERHCPPTHCRCTNVADCFSPRTYSPGHLVSNNNHFSNIITPNECQKKCQANDECEYFNVISKNWKRTWKGCWLRNANAKHGTRSHTYAIFGPKYCDEYKNNANHQIKKRFRDISLKATLNKKSDSIEDNCVWGTWSQWSTCSVSCEVGLDREKRFGK